MIKAVIFDMDGLLIDSEPLWRQAQAYAFGTVGLKLDDNDMRSTMGRRIDEVVEYWYHERPWKGASQQDITALIIDRVTRLIKSEGKSMPGVNHILDLFKNKHMPMALASSSSSAIINAVLDRLSIQEYFVHVYSGENETHGKPYPGIYITTASLLGVPARRCLVFEDSPSGVLAAKSANMQCVAVPDTDHKANKFIQTADVVINSLQEFNEIIFESLG